MDSRVAMIPADNEGGKIFIKDFRIEEDGKMFIMYRSTYNDIPFIETQIFFVDKDSPIVVICGDDGTIIWRFPFTYIQSLID